MKSSGGAFCGAFLAPSPPPLSRAYSRDLLESTNCPSADHQKENRHTRNKSGKQRRKAVYFFYFDLEISTLFVIVCRFCESSPFPPFFPPDLHSPHPSSHLLLLSTQPTPSLLRDTNPKPTKWTQNQPPPRSGAGAREQKGRERGGGEEGSREGVGQRLKRSLPPSPALCSTSIPSDTFETTKEALVIGSLASCVNAHSVCLR